MPPDFRLKMMCAGEFSTRALKRNEKKSTHSVKCWRHQTLPVIFNQSAQAFDGYGSVRSFSRTLCRYIYINLFSPAVSGMVQFFDPYRQNKSVLTGPYLII